jgi:hypothetical protein
MRDAGQVKEDESSPVADLSDRDRLIAAKERLVGS